VNNWDFLGMDWFDNVSDFCAGVADSLTFGQTRMMRRLMNRAIYGTWDDFSVNTDGTAYIAGEIVEVSVEIAVTLGGASLRHAAKFTTRTALEGGARQSFRQANNLAGKGGVVHHINPIKGHPGGQSARYPLPYEWSARGHWNMTWLPNNSTHMAHHNRMMMLDALDYYRTMTMGTRQAANQVFLYVESQIECERPSVTVSLNLSYITEINEALNIELGVIQYNRNAIPMSVSISSYEFGYGR